jgi:hypothetical protein
MGVVFTTLFLFFTTTTLVSFTLRETQVCVAGGTTYFDVRSRDTRFRWTGADAEVHAPPPALCAQQASICAPHSDPCGRVIGFRANHGEQWYSSSTESLGLTPLPPPQVGILLFLSEFFSDQLLAFMVLCMVRATRGPMSVVSLTGVRPTTGVGRGSLLRHRCSDTDYRAIFSEDFLLLFRFVLRLFLLLPLRLLLFGPHHHR